MLIARRFGSAVIVATIAQRESSDQAFDGIYQALDAPGRSGLIKATMLAADFTFWAANQL